jgi:hypothetical protein
MKGENDMNEKTMLDKLLDKEDAGNVELFAEDGSKVEFEQIAVLQYMDSPYAILRPVTGKENEVVVFRLFEDDGDRLDFVEDKTIAQNVITEYRKNLTDSVGTDG